MIRKLTPAGVTCGAQFHCQGAIHIAACVTAWRLRRLRRTTGVCLGTTAPVGDRGTGPCVSTGTPCKEGVRRVCLCVSACAYVCRRCNDLGVRDPVPFWDIDVNKKEQKKTLFTSLTDRTGALGDRMYDDWIFSEKGEFSEDDLVLPLG